MGYFNQLTALLSEPPGTVVFHLVTLFALQAILGMALNQWRQDRTDRVARRMAIAAGIIFLAQGVLLVLGLLWQNDAQTAVSYLPPLTQTAHAVTAVFITWALASHRHRLANLSNALLVAVLITLLVMTVSFTQEWQRQLAERQLADGVYANTIQSVIGAVFQLSLLTIGFFISLLHREGRRSLRPIIFAVLMAAHAAQLGWGQPAAIPTDNLAAFWLRLGYLIALPLWAVHVYRQQIFSRQPAPIAGISARQGDWPELMPHLTDIVSSLHPQPTLLASIELLEKAVHSRLIGLALSVPGEPATYQITTNLPQVGQNAPKTSTFNPDNWPALRQVREQGEGVELRPTGVGARQLHQLYAEFGLSSSLGAIYLHPLRVKSEWLGMLLLSHPQGSSAWSDEQRAAIPPLADFIAQAIDNSRLHTVALQKSGMPLLTLEPQDTGRLINLEEEHKRLEAELEIWQSRARQAEGRAAEARKQTQDLADTLQELERVNRDDKIQALQAEIEALRESLTSAEEAMAIAAAGEAELSTEWVMLTITRYSSQLEEAQARIEKLETQLRQQEKLGHTSEILQVLQDIRTPMTSIAGYTDLLLASEGRQRFSDKQQEFIGHIKANSQRVEQLLKQITEHPQSAAMMQQPVTNLEEALETAVHTVITHVREKHQKLELNVASDLPPLPLNQDALQQIMGRLLENAAFAAGEDGRISISLQTKALAAPAGNDHEEILKFVHLAIHDNGPGTSMADRAYVFDAPPPGLPQPLPGLGCNYQELAEVRNLAMTYGARMWVDGEPGKGNIFSVLFPISASEISTPFLPGHNGNH